MIEFQNCYVLSSELRITVTLYVLYFNGKKKCSRVEFFMLFKLKTDMYLINVPTRQKRRQAKKKDRVFLKGMFGSASFMGLFTPFKSSDFWSALEISFVLPKSDWPHGGMDRNQTCLQTYTDDTQPILPQYLHNTKTILEQYSHYTFKTLERYLNDTWTILRRYSDDTQTILERYPNDTQEILERYSNRYSRDTQTILEQYSNDTPMIL